MLRTLPSIHDVLIMLVPMLVASTSEMHDILVAMQRNISGGRQEATPSLHAMLPEVYARDLKGDHGIFDVQCLHWWHDCCSSTCAVVGMYHRYTTAFKCPIPTLSAQEITCLCHKEEARRHLSKIVPALSISIFSALSCLRLFR